MPPDTSPTDPLRDIEALVLSIVLHRVALRGRLTIEGDLRELEELVGHDLAPVRAQLDQLFGVHTAGTLSLPAPKEPLSLVPSDANQPPKRGPGRPRKDGSTETPGTNGSEP